MRASATEYKRQKRESQVQKLPQKALTQQSKKMQKAKKAPNPKHPGNPGHNEKMKPKDNKYRREPRFTTQRASKYLQ